MADDDTRALARAAAANEPMLERIARARLQTINGLDELVDDFIGRHEGSEAHTTGIEQEVARFRQDLHAAYVRAQSKLDQYFGARALTPDGGAS